MRTSGNASTTTTRTKTKNGTKDKGHKTLRVTPAMEASWISFFNFGSWTTSSGRISRCGCQCAGLPDSQTVSVAGGMKRSKSFSAHVYNTLHRLSKVDGPFQRESDGRWGLRAWATSVERTVDAEEAS